MSECCENCKFWRVESSDGHEGMCLRFPPQPAYFVPQDETDWSVSAWGFPETWADEWCGEFKPNGTKFDWSVWSARTRNAFGRGGIRTIEDLLAKTQDDLLQLRNFGATSLFEVREVLAKAGLSLLGE